MRDPVRMRDIVLFDLDFTLVPEDTRLLFANYIFRRLPGRRLFLLMVAPAAALTALGIVSRSFFNRLFFCFLKGLKADELEALADDFVQRHIPFYADMLDILQQAKSGGATVVLATASPALYIKPLARYLGADITLCTDWVAAAEHPLLVRYETEYNKGAAKMRALLPHLPEGIQSQMKRINEGRPYYIPRSSAFSDSPNDLPMLLLAEQAAVVHPSPGLKAIALRKGWRILQPAPVDSPARRRLRGLLQGLGLFPPFDRRFSIASTDSLPNLHSQL